MNEWNAYLTNDGELTVLRCIFTEDRVKFTGSPTGEHSISRKHSSWDRIRAHWDGYIEAADRALHGAH